MDHHSAFLQAIVEAPDDDAPRLIYADWLEENGQPERAQFIRIQCELARMPEDALERPMREQLELEYANLQEGPGVIWAEGTRALAASSGLARLTALNLNDNGVGTAGVRALAASPHLTRLTTLALSSGDVDDGAVEALAASPNFSQLTSLNLSGNPISQEGVRALATSRYLTRLTSLSLSPEQGIGAGGDATSPKRSESAHLPVTLCEFGPLRTMSGANTYWQL
jgi:uncharacterized protein (TIGR02996 family)